MYIQVITYTYINEMNTNSDNNIYPTFIFRLFSLYQFENQNKTESISRQ